MFGNILKMLFSYKFFTFSQHSNKFYNRKFQNIHLTQPKIKIKHLHDRSVRGGRKSERLKEREIDREREDRSAWRMAARSSGFRGGVEWAGGRWRPDR